MRLARHLYRAARVANNAEAVLSGDPERIGRRAKNLVVGRALARGKFWSLIWGAKR